MTVTEFYKGVAALQQNYPSLRYGQAVFNYAAGFGRPGSTSDDALTLAANEQRGTTTDPFYWDGRVASFIAQLPLEWS